MKFDPRQLDEIRSRLKVSDVVGSRLQLIKKGVEYVQKGNESFTVNDKKGFWCEFGSGGDGKPHDVFDFLQTYDGLSFVEAVEELARQAGVSLKNGAGQSSSPTDRAGPTRASGARSNGIGEGHPRSAGDDRASGSLGDAPAHSERSAPAVTGKKEIVATWDYVDPENNLLYQVVRAQDRMPDGSWRQKNGKTFKTFWQRRPLGDGTWIMGLDVFDRDPEDPQPLEFVKTERSTAWLRATDERLQWQGITIRTFPELSNVDHWMFNANAVLDELQEPKEDQRTIFLPEGEGKVDVLTEWGLIGTTNSAGAKHFTEACAELFRNARHVVLLQDNDRAGAERVAKIAPMLKAVGVELVQALNFRDVWQKCPMKGDIKDWRDIGGGTKDQLLEIVDRLEPWKPEPYQSKFGAKTSADLGTAVRAYPWRIKGILPMHDNVLVMGPSRSGKTFEVLDMVMHIHNGEPFAGRKTVQGGIVYLTYEGATGFENRLRAYLKHHNMSVADLHSFSWVTRPPNLYATEDNAKLISEEILNLADGFKVLLAAVVVDTHNAATRGSSEIKSEDINRIITNYDIVRETTHVPLIVIGHTNAEGKHRGNEQLFNAIETAILVERVYTDTKHTIEKRDDEGRVVRRGVVKKQREGDDNTRWEFVLQSVRIGTDEDGEAIPSMVSVEPAQHVPDTAVEEFKGRDRPEGFYLKGHSLGVFRALLKAIDSAGVPPPPELGIPVGIPRVITWAQLGAEYQKTDPREGDETHEKYRNRIKARVRRFREELLPYNVIGIATMRDPQQPGDDIEKPKDIAYVWPTGRKVWGKNLQWPAPPPKKKGAPDPLLAPGENRDDLPPDLF